VKGSIKDFERGRCEEVLVMTGIRIAVQGEGDNEPFTIIEFPDEPKRPGHFMTTSKPMTEAEFRAWLSARGIDEVRIEETIATRARRRRTH